MNSIAGTDDELNLPEGVIGSGAVAFLLRSSPPATILRSCSAVDDAGRATTGVFSRSCDSLKINCSDKMMCSAHSATDHTFGAGLNRHCASLTPVIAPRKFSFDFSSCSIRKARSPSVKAPEEAAASGSVTAAKSKVRLIMFMFMLLVVETFPAASPVRATSLESVPFVIPRNLRILYGKDARGFQSRLLRR